jgi:hypothetical protein
MRLPRPLGIIQSQQRKSPSNTKLAQYRSFDRTGAPGPEALSEKEKADLAEAL